MGIFWDYHFKTTLKIMYLFSSNSFIGFYGGMGSMVYKRDLRFLQRSGALHMYILGLPF